MSAGSGPFDAVEVIVRTVIDLRDIASAIAAAVEQQGAATLEIARGVAAAANGLNSLTERAGALALEAAETGRQAGLVRENSAAVSGVISQFNSSMVALIRDSSVEVEQGDFRDEAA